METIESIQNKQVKEWKKLLTRKGRKKQQKYIIEGLHLVEEAVKARQSIDALLVREDKLDEYQHVIRTFEGAGRLITITEDISAALSDAVTEQGILAVMNTKESLSELAAQKPLLLLDGVQDPGNLGTLIRTADAAGFEGVVIGTGSVDLYNPKALRSAQGSHFHLPVVHDDLKGWVQDLKAREIPVYGTALDKEARSYRQVNPSAQFALIVGNEGKGVSDELLRETTCNLYIPIIGQAESLNVAIAAGILMFSLYNPS
ncbi:rRNA methylase [Alkalibacterium sp. AK22]|uniref:TrmH family RNA methyltransferase n=1 Tax=Alkalibacterium sp. AK22 TaxID=1229520 RepID=UPI000449E172|nr:RNA methyltransferase [Alkalibacterium sp. AK22]EXJ23178.1 rRNA methylase [Alkalibacterium sp. AK22]